MFAASSRTARTGGSTRPPRAVAACGGGAQQVVDQGGHHRGAGAGAFAGEQVERVVGLRDPVDGVVADQEPPRVELGDRFDRSCPGWGQPGVGWGDVAQDRLGFQAAQRGQRGLVEAAALVGRGLEGALQAAGDRGQPGPAQQPDRCFAAGGQPVQDVAQGGAAVRGRDEQLPDQPFGALGEVRVGPLVPGADGLGEVGDQVLGVGHVRDAGQRVPPPGLLGAADPLRVQHEHPPELGAQPDGEGVDVDLVRGGHHRPDRGQHRGHHQGGGLVRPRPGDLQDHVFLAGVHVVSAEPTQPHPHLARVQPRAASRPRGPAIRGGRLQ